MYTVWIEKHHKGFYVLSGKPTPQGFTNIHRLGSFTRIEDAQKKQKWAESFLLKMTQAFDKLKKEQVCCAK